MRMEDLENCIQRYGRDLYSFCCYLTRSRQEADDLYQDTFLKAMEIADRLEPEDGLKNTLLSVAANLWRNKRRKSVLRQRITGPVISLDALSDGPGGWKPPADGAANGVVRSGVALADAFGTVEEPVSFAPQPLDAFVAREEEQIVRQAVAALPDRYRLPVLLFYMEDMKIPEIAAALRIPQGTVKSRLHKAKKLLAPKLKEVLDET